MAESDLKVGIISCSGEEIPEGTISRLAVRRVLELLRPDNSVTICLPLFLAGNEAEQEFARKHPTITVDGCAKLCAKVGTEKYSGSVSASLVVSDLLDGDCSRCARSARDRTDADKESVWIVSEKIASAVDSILNEHTASESCGEVEDGSCACTKPAAGMTIDVDGKSVTVIGLAMIFDNLVENGLLADGFCGEKLLETVRIYHPIEPEEEDAYKASLITAYQAYRRNK